MSPPLLAEKAGVSACPLPHLEPDGELPRRSSHPTLALPLELRFRYLVRPRRVLFILAAVWVLNLFDLHYTLLEAPQRHFRELNPVAAQLLCGPPHLLIAYKLLLVAIGSAIMLSLRNHRATELGCWLIFATYAFVGVCWQAYYAHAMDLFDAPAASVPSLAALPPN